MTAVFDPHVYIKTISIIGVGGTGASTARIVARILYDMQRSGKHTPDLVLIDPDRVEAKNIGRQALFMPSDIGKHKAECVARRLNFALGLNIAWIPEPVSASKHFDRYRSNLVISCVDNHLARREIHKINGVLIGAGNHNNAGQVCIGNTDDIELVKQSLDSDKVRYLPKEGVLFPDLLEPEPEPEAEPLSCAELTAKGEQDLLVNDWVSVIVGQYVYKLLHRQPIHSFLTFINADDLIVRSVPISQEELNVYLNAHR